MARALLLAGAEEERLKRQLIIDRRQIRLTSRPMDLPEREFIANFRLRKRLFGSLCEELEPLLHHAQRSTAVRPDIKVLAALTFYGHGCYQKNVGSHYQLGLSQTTVSDCIRDVTEALNKPEMTEKYIRFPKNAAEREAISMRFMEQHQVPGVLGCIDGTHIAIVKPSQYEEAYYNRKNYHSLNAMVICDRDHRILYVDASFGGASHDSHIWNNSELRAVMESVHEAGQAYWLLGDSGYAQRPWLMTPIQRGATPAEVHYTKKHVETRNVIERCFGILKTRWRCLLAHRTMHYSPEKAAQIMNACVVLHNMINDSRITIDEEEMARDRARQPAVQPMPDPDNRRDIGSRADLVERLWQGRGRGRQH